MCGFISVFGTEGTQVVAEVLRGLLAIQHRGQDAAGIVTYDDRFHAKKGVGLVRDVFAEKHLGIDPAVMSCAGCHDPHGSDDPGFFDSEVHAPFEARACEDCHVVASQ